jgi:fatty-acyl-CoA synthase
MWGLRIRSHAMRAVAGQRASELMSTLYGSTLSYVQGAYPQPLTGETIGRYFDTVCARSPDRDALVARRQGVRLSYGQLRERVDALACGLLRLGLAPGDRIGIWSHNNVEWVLTQLASAKAGLILVSINPAYRLRELEYALVKSGCRALVVAPRFKSSQYLDMLASLIEEFPASTPGQLRSVLFPRLQWIIRLGTERTPGAMNFDELLVEPTEQERNQLARIGATLQFDDPINIQFTSGTTGAPKGATLSHHNILNNGYFIGEALRLTADDRVCIPVPLYHCFGMVVGNLACLTHGAAMVYPAESFDPIATLQAVAEEGCTGLYGVPTMFIAMLDHPDFDRFDLTTLRTGILAGSPCPVEVMKRVIEKMQMREVIIAYGMTETSPASFQGSVDDPIELRASTVGRVHPHCEGKIIDSQGRIVPRGTQGELCIRGYNVMLGYWEDDARTAEVLDRNGWMHTGDLAVMDANGYCNIVGRIKDMVIRGGENVYPREIEEFLHRHPKIRDVQVVGVPDERYGEELCAWIVLQDGEQLDPDTVRRFCEGQIAHYKIPRYIKFVDAFPLTVTGKVQKYLIRENMARELGLAEGGGEYFQVAAAKKPV